jgi:hypothetical protein
MHKLINRIALGVLLLGAGYYFLQSKINSPEECQKIAGVWNEVTASCEQTDAQKIYDNLSTSFPMTMAYPESDIQVKLDKAENIQGLFYLRGHYEVELQAATVDAEALYDRGSLYLNMSKMVIVNSAKNGVVHYAAPFIANTAGSGVFVYVGLFSYDTNSKQSVHLDSALLGNRVREEVITHLKDYLQVDFLSHAKGQSYSEEPTEKTAVYLQLTDKFSRFNVVKRMHNSWDADNDGINDCESDGSCDHTINYTLPRVD